ncbi:MAG: ANTAR domain-containing protein [Acidimicrobiia bacterium]
MPTWDEPSAQVSRATGVISVQADCSVDEALVLMKAYAQRTGQSLLDVAEATNAHRVRFEPTT